MGANDKVARAYARLTGLKTTLDNMDRRHSQLQERYVEEFHGAVDHLAESGFNVDEFRIPPKDVDYRETSSGPDGVTYSDDRWVDRGLFQTKLETALTYFKLTTAQPKPQLGFHGPTR